MDTPHLPPLFRSGPLDRDDPFAVATARADDGEEAGTLLWSRRPDRLDLAVVLGPDRPLTETRLVVAVTLIALADALEALGPPTLAVSFGWPDRLLVNGALAGGVRFAAAPGTPEDEVPAWAVVGATVDVLGDPDDPDPGRHPDRTALREEGFGDLEVPALLESFARHFLSWTDIWEDAGFQPAQVIWQRRLDRPIALPELGAALQAPTWTLPERPLPERRGP